MEKNIFGEPLKICCKNPMTGYFRDGLCRIEIGDTGTHTVCAKMDEDFLEYTKSKGNDLSSVVKSGQNWCLCEYRWNESYKDGKSPYPISKATNKRTKPEIIKNIKNDWGYWVESQKTKQMKLYENVFSSLEEYQ